MKLRAEIMATFAEIITALREETGKKRQETADALGISRASLEYYEKGKRKPDIEILAKFADYYGVSADYLLGRTPCPDINISGNTQNNVNGDNNISVGNNDELASELSALLKSLNLRKRTELMTMIYKFVDTNKKE